MDTRRVTFYMSDGMKERIAELLDDPYDFSLDMDSDGTDSWFTLDVYQTYSAIDGYGGFKTYRFDPRDFAEFLVEMTPAELAEHLITQQTENENV
jgi:hypothetical protein